MSKAQSLQSLIDHATSETLLRSDIYLNSQVKDQINSRPDMPKEAIQHLKKRLVSRNPKVQYLTLDLLDYIINSTSLPFHTQVASCDFLSTLSQLYRSRDSDSQVKQRLKELLTD